MSARLATPSPAIPFGMTDTVPAMLFLGVYLFPSLFSPSFVSSMRGTALLHLFFYWAAMGFAATQLVRADLDPAATRRRVLVAGGCLAGLALLMGTTMVVALAPVLMLLVIIVWNLWEAAGAGSEALRVERALGYAMIPCLVVAVVATSLIKPYFDHQVRSPELLTAGLLLAQLAGVRAALARRLRR